MEAIKARLRQLLKQPKTTIENMCDFGDSGAHRLTITVVPARRIPKKKG